MPASASRLARLAALVALGLTTTLATIDTAEARRASGGFSGFGSRGTKTFSAPAPTRTAPDAAAPIERSMTPKPAQPSAQPQTNGMQTSAPAQAQRNGGLFGSFGRSMLGGLLVGGLFGMLLGQGFGGFAGFFGLILQVAIIGFLVMMALRFFANRNAPSPASAATGGPSLRNNATPFGQRNPAEGFKMPDFGGQARQSAPVTPAAPVVEPLDLDGADFDRFEALLGEVQSAYGREDYAALRQITTPEAMSYLAEELGENATNGLRNSVKDVRLVQGDLSEAWSEEGADYATVAMRYESIDVMLDRSTGKVVSGDPDTLSESTELWTFTRKRGGDWLLSAIQGVA